MVYTFSQTAKMVPVDTLQSMLEDPSRGSNATQYFPVDIDIVIQEKTVMC